jgi:hypothetical protein
MPVASALRINIEKIRDKKYDQPDQHMQRDGDLYSFRPSGIVHVLLHFVRLRRIFHVIHRR